MIEKLKDLKIKGKKNGAKNLVMTIDMILGEVQRTKNKANINDEVVYDCIDFLVSKERELLNDTKQSSSEYLDQLLSFRRPKISYETTMSFFSKIDFSKLKNKMQAIGMIKREFGEKNVDSYEAQQIMIEYLLKSEG